MKVVSLKYRVQSLKLYGFVFLMLGFWKLT
jgi:hypothetical protein